MNHDNHKLSLSIDSEPESRIPTNQRNYWPQRTQNPTAGETLKAPIGARKIFPTGQTYFAFFVAKIAEPFRSLAPLPIQTHPWIQPHRSL